MPYQKEKLKESHNIGTKISYFDNEGKVKENSSTSSHSLVLYFYILFHAGFKFEQQVCISKFDPSKSLFDSC